MRVLYRLPTVLRRTLHVGPQHTGRFVKGFRAAGPRHRHHWHTTYSSSVHGSIMLKRLEEDDIPGAEPRAAANESTNEGLPKKVLVAEDNVVSQQVARRFLEA